MTYVSSCGGNGIVVGAGGAWDDAAGGRPVPEREREREPDRLVSPVLVCSLGCSLARGRDVVGMRASSGGTDGIGGREEDASALATFGGAFGGGRDAFDDARPFVGA